MGLKHVAVRNFQSLHALDLELGDFTVVVGASNSGKSAFLRALRTLFHNASSPSFVTTGKKTATISAEWDDISLALERGKSLSTYTFDGEVYAKAGTSVPEDISKALALPELEGEDLNFAFQFDRPFLLAESATKVAKVLGDLTNINVLFEAVRAANRRKLDRSAKLKVRLADHEKLLERIPAYRDIPEAKKSLDASRTRLEALRASQVRLAKLRELTQVGEVASAALEAISPIPEFDVDISGVESKVLKLMVLKDAFAVVTVTRDVIKTDKAALTELDEAIESCRQEYEDTLVALGTCPMCGQAVEKEHVHA